MKVHEKTCYNQGDIFLTTYTLTKSRATLKRCLFQNKSFENKTQPFNRQTKFLNLKGMLLNYKEKTSFSRDFRLNFKRARLNIKRSPFEG